MKISDSFTLNAPQEEVWAFLLDIEQMSQCIPGAQEVEQIDEKTYRGALKLRIGPIAPAFRGTVTLSELDPPNRLVAKIAADDDGSGSTVKARFTSTLSTVAEGTEVSFETEVNLRGRLAQFGSAVVRGTARKVTAEFRKCVEQEIDAG